jgi:hypothetical protein
MPDVTCTENFITGCDLTPAFAQAWFYQHQNENREREMKARLLAYGGARDDLSPDSIVEGLAAINDAAQFNYHLVVAAHTHGRNSWPAEHLAMIDRAAGACISAMEADLERIAELMGFVQKAKSETPHTR